MGDLTLSDLQAEIRANLGGRTDYNDNLTNWINFVQDMMARQIDFPELETTITTSVFTTDAATYTFSTRPRVIHSVRLLDGYNSRKLEYVPLRFWDERIPKPDQYTTARSSHYTFYQNKLEYWRVPDDDYDGIIRLSTYPTNLSSSGDYSDFDSKDDVIVCLATAWAFRTIGNKDQMYQWGNAGWAQLREAIRSEFRKTDVEIKPIGEIKSLIGDYWKDPFVRGMRHGIY